MRCFLIFQRCTEFCDLQSEVPNGVVNLRGAVVQKCDQIPFGFEIVAGELYSSKHVMRRTYYFTPAGAGTLRDFAMNSSNIKDS